MTTGLLVGANFWAFFFRYLAIHNRSYILENRLVIAVIVVIHFTSMTPTAAALWVSIEDNNEIRSALGEVSVRREPINFPSETGASHLSSSETLAL